MHTLCGFATEKGFVVPIELSGYLGWTDVFATWTELEQRDQHQPLHHLIDQRGYAARAWG